MVSISAQVSVTIESIHLPEFSGLVGRLFRQECAGGEVAEHFLPRCIGICPVNDHVSPKLNSLPILEFLHHARFVSKRAGELVAGPFKVANPEILGALTIRYLNLQGITRRSGSRCRCDAISIVV